MTSTIPVVPDGAIAASQADLIRLRPDRKLTGFAPSGKVSTHQFGNNRSVFRGRGMEFDEARIYQPDDDARSIDWRVTARTGKVHTKLFHEERERPVFILVDLRSMMHFGTRVRFKSVLAAQVAAILGWVGIDGGDRVGGIVLHQTGLMDFQATRARKGMLGFLHGIASSTRTIEATGEHEVALHLAVQRLRHVARPGTLAFVISDFNDFDDRTEQQLERLSLHSHVTLIQMFDQLDASLPRSGRHAVSDGEALLELGALDQVQLEAHATAFADRRQRLEAMARRRRMAWLSLSTADAPQAVLQPRRPKSGEHRMRRAA